MKTIFKAAYFCILEANKQPKISAKVYIALKL